MKRLFVGVLVVAAVVVPSPAFADDTRGDQWMLESLDIAKTHEITKGAGTRIGLIDTGVDADHPDLKGNIEKGLDTWVDTQDGRRDVLGHGTEMASLLVGHGHGENNADGVLGVAPEATIVPVNVYPDEYDPNDQSEGREIDKGVAEGLRWLADEKVDVIVMAFGGSSNDGIEQAVKYAAEKDIPMFAGTGNNNGGEEIGDTKYVDYPAANKLVTAVAGTNRNGDQWEGSNFGREVLISAPAEDVIAAAPGGKYSTASGTSNSTAIVGGVAALMDSQWPDMSWETIQWRLIKTADDTEAKKRDEKTGFGIVNPLDALTKTDVEIPEGDTNEEINPEPNPRPSGSPSSKANDSTLTGESSQPSSLVWWVIGAAIALAAAVAVVALLLRHRRRNPR